MKDATDSKPLVGQIALVAGATRGAGRGIATMLGEAGATVYCTGRSVRGASAMKGRPECIEDTAELVTAHGGRGIAIQVDGSDAEWSSRGIRDAGDELHPATRALDIISLRLEHSATDLFACLRMAAPGFRGEPPADLDIGRNDTVTFYIEPLAPRYQSPEQVSVSSGTELQSGTTKHGQLAWRAAGAGDTLEFSIRRTSGQNRYRVFAWADAQRWDAIGDGAWMRIQWANK